MSTERVDKPMFAHRFRRRLARLWLVAAACLLVAASPTPALALSYVDLVLRLIDLEALAVLPAPGEGCLQWSSHDRASRYDACADRYVDWDANDDGHGVIRKEGVSYVLAEMEGPGCIYRIWSANPGDGHVRIFLDGAAEPTVDLPFRAYFDLRSPPFVYRSLVHTAAGGYNCYVPIPFQESCKITADEGWGDYYHFTYVIFPKSEPIPTFRRNLSPEGAAALLAVDRFLANKLGSDPAGRRPGEVTDEVTVTLPPQQEAVAFTFSGERAITGLRVKPLGDGGDLASALREVILKIRWDGEPDPSVWAPLGDFFGTAPGINQYRSLPLGMTDDGFYSLWYMPFAVEALVEVANEGTHPITLEFSVTHAPLSRPIHELGRFHAKWHRDSMLPTRPDRMIDWTVLKVQGRGRFCGAMLHVWNPRGGWWGEGDEKFFVDGERFPSTFGTGSEDYFGYAGSNSSLFEHAYHNQTLCENGNVGHVSVNRWQIADSVPFQTSFEGVIEKYFPNSQPTLYACMAYWYQGPAGIDPYGPVPVAQRAGCYNYVPVAVPGALE